MARIRPKSIKEGFNIFFKLFLNRAGILENEDPDLPYRYIKYDTQKDVALFSKSVIKAERKDYDGKMTFLVTCRGKTFFITLGYQNINMPKIIMPEDTSVGLFMAVVIERGIQIKGDIDNLKIENEIIVPIENRENPQGYELEKIVEYFPEINVYRVIEPINDYNVMLDKLSIMMYCANKSLLRLNISDDILLCYCNLINQGFENINYDNLWRSISSNEWRYCFIELYRCLEILFNISRTFDLSDKINSRHDLSSLFSFSWKELKDYYHEDKMIEFLFGQLSQPKLDMLKSITSIKNASGFYCLRNSIVHGRRHIYYNNTITKDREWQSLILFTINAIEELYSLYDNDLSNFDESVVKSNRRK